MTGLSFFSLEIIVNMSDTCFFLSQELERVMQLPSLEGCILGINNRDLQTFIVDLKNTKDILESPVGRQVLEQGIMVVGESGIFTPADLAYVQAAGTQAVLVGESLVKQGDPAVGIQALYA